MNENSYYSRENGCQYIFNTYQPFFHLCTPGKLVSNIFPDTPSKELGLNLIGICTLKTEAFLPIAFALMDDHLHILYSGTQSSGERFFDSYSSRLARLLGKEANLSGFIPQYIEVPDLNAVRNEIAYINRNGYVVHPNHTPFSYPWSSGAIYFNPYFKHIPSKPYSSLAYMEKRVICRSRDLELPGSLPILGKVIAPYSFCYASDIGEKLFRDAHHYFNLLSKNYEAYSEIAKRLGDSVLLPDEEMFGAVRQICVRQFNVGKPSLLTARDRIEVARRMHYDYNATNKQIQRILRLEASIVDEMFPTAVTRY